ncbi:MAG: phenylalanine--tRNA ligase subunit alpha, partial [Candidatus Thermoplasmatota archaeon]
MGIKKTIKELSEHEKKLLKTLQKLNGKASPEEIYNKGDFQKKVEVMNASSWLQSKKLVNINEKIIKKYYLEKEGKKFIKEGLPEKKVIKKIIKNNGKASLSKLTQSLQKKEISVAIGWLKKKGWAKITKENGETFLTATEKGKKANTIETEEEKILKKLNEKPGLEIEKSKIKELLSRKNVLKEKETIISTITLTEKAKELLQHEIKIKKEITQITSQIIKNQEWKQKEIRPYDIEAFAPATHGGKPHPLIHLINKIRKIFLQMGFEEIQGNFVENCFWNMDTLFIPQDHPAREMQDTFYLENPKEIEIKDKKLLQKITDIHENGGITSSEGWRYNFSKKEGRRTLLRTHTTVNTIRYLYNHPEPPSKVFSIGRVYRKENIDSTHLPEFYQIEGIIHEKNISFKQLL